MNRQLGAIAAVGMLLTVAAAGQNSSLPVRQRIIDRNFPVRLPVAPCSVPSEIQFIAGSVGAVSGVEYDPAPCDWASAPPKPTDEINLLGSTIEEALNTLVKLDPRYAWQESEGVIMLRPIAAWTDPKHFLHESIGPIEFENKTMATALDLVHPIIGRKPGDGVTAQLVGRTPQGWQEFSVRLPGMSAFEALNAIVRAHGNLHWQLQYCGRERSREHVRLDFYTTDKSGLGIARGCR